MADVNPIQSFNSLQTFTTLSGNNVLISNGISSLNFNGNIPKVSSLKLISDIEVGDVVTTSEFKDSEESYLIVEVVDDIFTINNVPTTLYFLYYLSDEGRKQLIFGSNYTDNTLSYYGGYSEEQFLYTLSDDTDNIDTGTDGWMISNAGNAIFANGYFRGTIEATDGIFSGTVSAGGYNSRITIGKNLFNSSEFSETDGTTSTIVAAGTEAHGLLIDTNNYFFTFDNNKTLKNITRVVVGSSSASTQDEYYATFTYSGQSNTNIIVGTDINFYGFVDSDETKTNLLSLNNRQFFVTSVGTNTFKIKLPFQLTEYTTSGTYTFPSSIFSSNTFKAESGVLEDDITITGISLTKESLGSDFNSFTQNTTLYVDSVSLFSVGDYIDLDGFTNSNLLDLNNSFLINSINTTNQTIKITTTNIPSGDYTGSPIGKITQVDQVSKFKVGGATNFMKYDSGVDKLTLTGTLQIENIKIGKNVATISSKINDGIYFDDNNYWLVDSTDPSKIAKFKMESGDISKSIIKIFEDGIIKTSDTVGDNSPNSRGVIIDKYSARFYPPNSNQPKTTISTQTGIITATEVDLTGSIKATSGYIGGATSGWTINSGYIKSSGGTAKITLDATNGKIYVGTGSYGNTNTPFYVDSDSQFSLADKLTFTGGNLSITGAVTATSGNIGGWTLLSNQIYSNNLSLNSTYGMVAVGTAPNIAVMGSNSGFWAGAQLFSNAPFSVDLAGNLKATSANITGTINASSGNFTGFVTAGTARFGAGVQTNKNGLWLNANNYWYDDGTINAVTGAIGGWSLASGEIYSGSGSSKISLSSVNGKITMGTGNHGSVDTGFYVDSTGKFSLSNQLIFNTGSGTTSSLNTTGTFTTSSPTITVPSGLTIVKGMTVTGTGIDTNTYVTNVSGTTITVSKNPVSNQTNIALVFVLDDFAELQVVGRIKGVIDSTQIIGSPRLSTAISQVVVSGTSPNQTATITTGGHAFLANEKVLIENLPTTAGLNNLNREFTISTITDSVTFSISLSGVTGVTSTTTSGLSGVATLRELTMGLHPQESVGTTYEHSQGTGIRLDKYNWWFTNNQFRIGTSGSYIKWNGSQFVISGANSTSGYNLQMGVGPTAGTNYYSIVQAGQTPTYNTTTTPFYVDDTGQFSLGQKLKFDTGGNLTITGNINATSGSIGSGNQKWFINNGLTRNFGQQYTSVSAIENIAVGTTDTSTTSGMYAALLTGTSATDPNNPSTGLYIKDYSKTRLDYAYFGNEGLYYKSSNSVNLFLNPGAEGYSSNTPTSWNLVSLGGTTNTNYTQSIFNISSSTDPYYYFDQGVVGWKIILGSNPSLQNGYAALQVDGSSAYSYKGMSEISTANSFNFGYYSYPTFNLANSAKNIISITSTTQTQSITAISYSAATTTSPAYITYTATNSFVPGQKVSITNATYSQYNFGDAVVASATSTQFTVYATVTGTPTTSTATVTSYPLTITTSTAHNLRVGDLFYADADAYDIDTNIDYLMLYSTGNPQSANPLYYVSSTTKLLRVLSVTGYNTFTIQNTSNTAPNGAIILYPSSQATAQVAATLTVGTGRTITVDSTSPFLLGDSVYVNSAFVGTITNIPDSTHLTVTISSSVTIAIGDAINPAPRLFRAYSHTFDLDSAKVRFANNSYTSFKNIVTGNSLGFWDQYRYTYVDGYLAVSQSLSDNFIPINTQKSIEISPYKLYQQYNSLYPSGYSAKTNFYFDLPLWTLKQNISYDNSSIIYNNSIMSIYIPTGTASANIYMPNIHNIVVNDVVVLSNMVSNASLGTIVNGTFTVSAIGVNYVTITGFTGATAGTYSISQGNIAAKFGPSGYATLNGGQSLTVGTGRTIGMTSTTGFAVYDPVYIAGTYVGYVTAVTNSTTLTITVTTAKIYTAGDQVVNYYDSSFGVILDQVLFSDQSTYFDGDSGSIYSWKSTQYTSASIKNTEAIIDVQQSGANLYSILGLSFKPSYSRPLNLDSFITTRDFISGYAVNSYSLGNSSSISGVNALTLSSGQYKYTDSLSNAEYQLETLSQSWVSREGTGIEIISTKEDTNGGNLYRAGISLYLDNNNSTWFTVNANKAVIVDDAGNNSFTTFPNDGTGFSNSTTGTTTAYLNRYYSEGTNLTTISTTYTPGSTWCAFRFKTGVTGKIAVTVGGLIQAETDGQLCALSYEIHKGTTVTANPTVAASDGRAFSNYNTQFVQGTFTTFLSLSPNTTYYIRAMHRTGNAASTAYVYNRVITVMEIK